MSAGALILAVGLLLAASVAASLMAARVRIPALLLFLALGMMIGSDGAGWIGFDHYRLARDLGLVALALILFDGGLRTGLTEVRRVLVPAAALAVGGTVVTAVVTAMAAVTFFEFTPLEALLLGSIIASTDSAAVFGLLRGSTLSRRLVQTLEGEAGFNDPVALVLVLGFVEWIRRPELGPGHLAVFAVQEFVIGAVCGFLVATMAVVALRAFRLPLSGLYPVASLAAAALAYGAADGLHGSGLLAVYLAGLVLGDARIPERAAVTVFHDGAAWVAQIGLFVMLGLLSFPSRLGAAASEGIVIALVVMLVARPLAVLVTTVRQGFSLSERAVLSWAGLRGAAPVVFATFPVAAGTPGSTVFFDIVFFAVVVSTLVQGLTFEPFARWLGATSVAPPLPRPVAEAGGPRRLGAELVEYDVTSGDRVVARRVRDLALPLGSALVLIVRAEEAVLPAATARLRAGDTLHILVREEIAARIPELLRSLRGTGAGPPSH